MLVPWSKTFLGPFVLNVIMIIPVTHISNRMDTSLSYRVSYVSLVTCFTTQWVWTIFSLRGNLLQLLNHQASHAQCDLLFPISVLNNLKQCLAQIHSLLKQCASRYYVCFKDIHLGIFLSNSFEPELKMNKCILGVWILRDLSHLKYLDVNPHSHIPWMIEEITGFNPSEPSF